MKNWKTINSTFKFKHQGTQEIIKIILKNRGIKTKKEVDEFLNPKLESISLESVKIDKLQVKKALKRIQKAVENNENIVIYGDYDVDGICGAAILWETIYSFYKNVIPYIPHRVDEGYGLSVSGINNLETQNEKLDLIITVDNGVVAYDAVDYANKNKIDVIITDHHVLGKKSPNSFATVHTTNLCGAGVAWVLSKEILKTFDKKLNTDHLDLVALATVADMVPLIGDNRTLLKFGLETLRKTKRVGLLALFKQAVIEKENIGVYEIGHVIAPRLNAAGRVASAMDSLRLICTKDPVKAELLAQKLGQTNKERQALTTEMSMHAISLFEKGKNPNILLAASRDYNQGVIGLVASRLVENYYRPSIAVSIGEDVSKGSARSVVGFNIIEFIRRHSEFLIDAGGHPMAAGFTIKTEHIEAFKTAIEKSSLDLISAEHLTRNINIDCELPFEAISLGLMDEIEKLSPFGVGNPEPVFMSKNVRVKSSKLVGRDRNHLKLELSQDGKSFSAMSFSNPDSGIKEGDVVDTVCTVSINTWNGRRELTLKIKDLRLRG